MTQEEIIKHLHEALNSVDITFPYRYVLVEAIETLSQPSLPSNLDETAENLALLYDNGTCDGIAQDCFIAGAKYQRKQDQQLIELAEDHAMLAGMNKMKEEMMEKAVEGRVSAYDNGKIRIYTELLDGDIGFNFGDKVKVIVIPEEK